MFDPDFEPFVDQEIGKELIMNPELDNLLRVRSCRKSPDFHVERIPGKIVWRTFDFVADAEQVWKGIDVLLPGIGQLARAAFSSPVTIERYDSLHITYTLNWWYSGGGGSDLPSRGLRIRPKTLVPPLWRVPDLCFSLSC